MGVGPRLLIDSERKTPEPATIDVVVPCAPAPPPRRNTRWIRGRVRAALALSALALPIANAEKLAPGEARATSADDTLVLSDGLRTELGVRTDLVRQTDFCPSVEANGSARFAPQFAAEVGTGVSGIVRSVRHVLGDTVKEGEVLAVVDSPSLALLESEAASYRAHMKAAVLQEARVEKLLDEGYSTARTLESSAARKKELAAELAAAERTVSTLGGGSGRGSYAIRASKAGTVVAQRVSVGQFVRDNEIVFEIANAAHLWVEVSVEEKSIQGIHVDDGAEVTSLGRPNVTMKCRVASVGSVVDEATITVPVRIVIDNTERQLRSGEAVRATLHPSGRCVHDALLVPRSAVFSVDGEAHVLVVGDGGRLRPTKVELGESDRVDQRILAGVTAESTVVTLGTAGLRERFYR
jgi:cobalt-zinc-cadmium efflux system membrane fusion protein